MGARAVAVRGDGRSAATAAIPKQFSMPTQTDLFLQGVPVSFGAFMWSQAGASLPEQSIFMDCGAYIAMTPGSAAMTNTTATRALIRVRSENSRDRICDKLGFIDACFNQRGVAGGTRSKWLPYGRQ